MMPKNEPDWEGEFDSLVQKMRTHFLKNRINEFLQTHQQINVLFSSRLQFLIDKKPESHQSIDYNFNVDPGLMKKIDSFNENMGKLTGGNQDGKEIKIQGSTLQGKAY